MKLALGEHIPPHLLETLPEAESALARELAERGDTLALSITGDCGGLLGYAVIGLDLSDFVTVYAARAIKGMAAKMAMRSIFGAAAIAGHPVRVHTEKVRAMARMMGADTALNAVDMDGLPMGIFAHGQ